jgi:hypothetical protein
MKAFIAIAVSMIAVFAIVIGVWVSTSNAEIGLREQIGAQQKNIELVYDKMWKTLQQKAQIADQYKGAFKEIYPDLIAGRYSQGDGSLMKWVQEHNPTFDTSLYLSLSQAVEGLRSEFHREQKMLLDLSREHNTMLKAFPGSLILAGRSAVEIKTISSAKSKEAMETGEENDTDLFGN